jgi:hypothetical protein
MCLVPLASPGSAPALPPVAVLLQQFDDVAFGHEHGPSRGILQRWDVGPDLVLFREGSFDLVSQYASIQRHLRALAALTGLHVTASNDLEIGTLRLGFLPHASFEKLSPAAPRAIRDYLTNSACIAMAFSDVDQPGRIARGVVVIGTDISPRTRTHCLLEELVQVLGLPNDACHYRPSLFCESDYVTEMTSADRILVKTLYDERLRPGLARKDALPIARTIMQELLHAGGV